MEPVTAVATTAEPLYLHLSVTDPDALAALAEAGEGRERQELALTALKIGPLSLKAARGTLDGAVVRAEGERLLAQLEERLWRHREGMDQALSATLRTYFDPASGASNERVERLWRQDGELAQVIGSQVLQAQVRGVQRRGGSSFRWTPRTAASRGSCSRSASFVRSTWTAPANSSSRRRCC